VGVVNVTPQPLYPRARDTLPTAQEVGWAPVQYGWVRKISPPHGFDPLTVQPVASRKYIIIIIIIIIVEYNKF
jgi:hypothetical protein